MEEEKRGKGLGYRIWDAMSREKVVMKRRKTRVLVERKRSVARRRKKTRE